MKIRSLIATFAAACMTAAMLTSSISAMSAVGNVNVPYGTPKIDGTISKGEWDAGAKVNFSSKTAKAWEGSIPEGFNTDVRVLWDEKGIYFSGEIVEPTLKASSDGKYDGDAFQISLDMGQYFATTSENRAIFYSFGLNETKPMIQRQESKNNAVMYDGDGVSIKTWKTDKGWAFEALLTWDMLKNDANLKSGQTFDPKAGFKLNAMFCYMDKDASGKVTSAFGTTLTGDDVKYDWGPKDHGITLTLEAKKTTPTTTAPATADVTVLLMAVSAASALVVSKRRK